MPAVDVRGRWLSPQTAISAAMTAGVAVFSGQAPPPNLAALVPRIAPRPLLLIHSGIATERLNELYHRIAGEPKTLWEIPGAGHTGGLVARPDEYERLLRRSAAALSAGCSATVAARNAADVLVFGSVMVPTAQAAALERLAGTVTLESPPPTRRMLVIVNPYATTMSVRLKQLVVYALQGRFEVEAVDTQRKGHATELCRAAADEGYDVVVAFGGDGTVNEVANGLAGSATVLTCLPGGATNVYCRMLGIPTDVVDATEHLLRLADKWAPRAVDLARVNDRWFTFSAGAGLDATVVRRVDSHPALKARFGPWYYAQSAVATFLQSYVVNPPRVVATAAGRETRGVSVFVQNAQPYTYFRRRPIHLAGGAHLESGDLSGAVLTRANALDVPTIGYRLLARRASVGRHRRVHAFDGLEGLRVRSYDERPVPVQVDGDFIGHHEEAVFSVLPGGLRVLG